MQSMVSTCRQCCYSGMRFRGVGTAEILELDTSTVLLFVDDRMVNLIIFLFCVSGTNSSSVVVGQGLVVMFVMHGAP